jgi:hypothetical protein
MTARDPSTQPHSGASHSRRRGGFGDHDLAAPPPPRDLRAPGRSDQVLVVAALNVIAGIWLIISPWVIGYDSGDATWNPIVFGALVVVFALGRIAMPARTAALSALNALIGVWLFISGFWLADSTGASWNAWILGVIVFVLACAGLASTRDDRVAA